MRTALEHPWVRSLSSTRLGIVLGFAASALLALSSLTIPDPRGGEALPFSESLEPFLTGFQARYAWFWPLAAVLTSFGLNVLLSTLRSALLRRRGTWDLRFSGIVLMHLAVVLGLATHLAAGLSAKVERAAVLTGAPTTLAGHALALVELSPRLNPDGTLRSVTATVDVDGKRRTLAHNEPLFFDGLRRFVLLQEVRPVAGAALFSVAGRRTRVAPGEALGAGEQRWVLVRISSHPSLRAPVALVRAVDAPNVSKWLVPHQNLAPDVAFEGVTTEYGLAVIVRRNDGIPVLVAASAIFSLGLVLFLLGRRRRAAGRGTAAGAPGTR